MVGIAHGALARLQGLNRNPALSGSAGFLFSAVRRAEQLPLPQLRVLREHALHGLGHGQLLTQ